MVFAKYYPIYHMTATMSVLPLLFLLAACGGNNAPHTAPTPSAAFMTYRGSGFTIKYPQNWQVTSAKNEVDFADLAGNTMTIGFSPNPSSATSPDQLADSALAGAKANMKNPQMVNVPATMTISNQIWSQRAVSGISSINGQSENVEAVILATNYPKFAATTKSYTLIYATSKDTFEQSKRMYFAPMLQSFAFIPMR